MHYFYFYQESLLVLPFARPLPLFINLLTRYQINIPLLGGPPRRPWFRLNAPQV